MRLSSAVTSPLLGISISSTALSIVALGYQSKSAAQIKHQSINQNLQSSNSSHYQAHAYSQNHYYLQSYGIIELKQAQVMDNRIVDVEQMGQIIAQLMQRLQLQAKHAATAMSQALTLSQHIIMPAWMLDVEIEAQICIDAEQYIPYPLAEVSFDFEVIGPADKGDQSISPDISAHQVALDTVADALDVLLVVTLTHHVEQMVDSLTFAGLNTQLIEVDTHAIERSLQLICGQLPDRPAAIALIDIGHSRTTVYVVKQGVFIYQNEQLFGGAQLTQSLQDGYQLSAEEAQQVKIHWTKQVPTAIVATNTEGIDDIANTRNNIDYADYVEQHLIPFAENLVTYVKQALQSYFQPAATIEHAQSTGVKINAKTASTPHLPPQIEQVVLCGGSAALSQLDDILHDKLGLPVLIANPFDNMSLSPTIDKAQLLQDAPRLMTACGLSLRACAEAKHKKKGFIWRR